MFEIDIEKKCGCFKKRFKNTLPIKVADEKEAHLISLEYVNSMNKNFCKKHRFYVKQKKNRFIIKIS